MASFNSFSWVNNFTEILTHGLQVKTCTRTNRAAATTWPGSWKWRTRSARPSPSSRSTTRASSRSRASRTCSATWASTPATTGASSSSTTARRTARVSSPSRTSGAWWPFAAFKCSWVGLQVGHSWKLPQKTRVHVKFPNNNRPHLNANWVKFKLTPLGIHSHRSVYVCVPIIHALVP